MVFKNNKGSEKDEIIQNTFSAYLLASVNRTRKIYLSRKEELERTEISISQSSEIIDKEAEEK